MSVKSGQDQALFTQARGQSNTPRDEGSEILSPGTDRLQPLSATTSTIFQEGLKTGTNAVPRSSGSGIDHQFDGLHLPLASTIERKSNTDGINGRPILARQNTSRPFSQVFLPPNVWELIDHYYAFTHSWLPISEQQDMMKLTYAYPSSGLAIEPSDTAAHAELWSIFALAAHQTSKEKTSVSSPHDVSSIHTSMHTRHALQHLPRPDRSTVETYRSLARELVPSERRVYDLGHVKALILLALIDIDDEKWQSAWFLIGHAVRMVIDLGLLGTSNTSGSISRAISDQKANHVLLSCFILDRALGSRLGRPAHLTPSHISISTISEEGLDEWSPWQDPLNRSTYRQPVRALSTFNSIVRITLATYALPSDSSTCIAVVQSLLHNASRRLDRMQPSTLMTTLRASGLSPSVKSGYRSMVQGENPLDAYGSSLHNGAQPGTSTLGADVSGELYRQRTFAHVSEYPGANLQNQVNPGIDASSVVGDTSLTTFDFNGDNDIFEELAMLDGAAQQEPNPQFMQNLGFAPDLDLAAFFGADYQPSDPMLAYLNQDTLLGQQEGSRNGDVPGG